MPVSMHREPLCRLLQIVIALQSDRRPNARQLAEELEVSRRTIFRDLETITLAGLPVEYDASRQGYTIATERAVRPLSLGEREVVALAVLANGRADGDPFGLSGPARSALAKLIDGLPEPSRRRVEAVGSAMHEPARPTPLSPARRAIYERILDAISRGVQIRLLIHEPGRGAEMTLITPYRLIPGREGWSLVGRSSFHRRVRLMPLARVEAAELTDEPAPIPPRFRADRWMARTWSGEPGRGRFRVRLRFEAEAAPVIRDGLWHTSQQLEDRPDGRLDLTLWVDRPEDLASWVLGHGDQVEILRPARLRRKVRRLALRVALRLGSPRRKATATADFPGVGG